MHFLMQPNKTYAVKMAELWFEGCGGGTLLHPSSMEALSSGVSGLQPGPIAMYGLTPETMPLFLYARMEKRDFYYIDNAYFGAGHEDHNYMRVTKNALQCDGYGNATVDRFRIHGWAIKPWKMLDVSNHKDSCKVLVPAGNHILVTCQSEWWYLQHGTTLQLWLDSVLTELSHYTDRPIRVRLKPKSKYKRPPNLVMDGEITGAEDQVPFLKDLDNAWAVVTHASNTAVEAIMEGVPAFVLGQCAAKPMACSDLAFIEKPRRPEGRGQWAWNLAANQWTLGEIRDGTCWRMINATT